MDKIMMQTKLAIPTTITTIRKIILDNDDFKDILYHMVEYI